MIFLGRAESNERMSFYFLALGDIVKNDIFKTISHRVGGRVKTTPKNYNKEVASRFDLRNTQRQVQFKHKKLAQINSDSQSLEQRVQFRQENK